MGKRSGLSLFLKALSSRGLMIISFIMGTVLWYLFSFYVLMAKNIATGEEPSFHANVVVVSPQEKALKGVNLQQLSAFLEKNPQAYFLLPEHKGEIKSETQQWGYEVLESSAVGQKIEVNYSDETYSSSTIYLANHDGIKPLWSSMTGAVVLLQGVIAGIVFAFFLRAVGASIYRWYGIKP